MLHAGASFEARLTICALPLRYLSARRAQDDGGAREAPPVRNDEEEGTFSPHPGVFDAGPPRKGEAENEDVEG